MHYEIKNKPELRKCFDCIQTEFGNKELYKTCYIKLGSKIVRILCYSKEFFAHIQKQLTYTLLENAEFFDATIIVWQENDIEKYVQKAIKGNIPLTMRMRHHEILTGEKTKQLVICDSSYSKHSPVIRLDVKNGFVIGNDVANNTYYYGVRDLSPEEFIKEGHIFVQFFNKIIQSDNANLVHGAVVGMNNSGVLFCGRGQRGKSTLTVLSMVRGFEYVSDDYLILEKEGNVLYSDPIYSIITLSPRMYTELYDDLKGKFVSNNARKDKYVLNIEGYHDQFRTHYPIKLCIFPEIVSDKEPSIIPCSIEEKGRAMVQFIQSTVAQVQDINRQDIVKKIYEMIADKEFYKLNLCNDIEKNTVYLKEFLQTWKPDGSKVIGTPEIMLDITFDLANIIDTKTFKIFSMNKFATNLLENLMNGVSPEEIKHEMVKYVSEHPNICADFDKFVQVLKEYNFIKQNNDSRLLNINWQFAEEEKYKISVLEYAKEKTIDLVNQ